MTRKNSGLHLWKSQNLKTPQLFSAKLPPLKKNQINLAKIPHINAVYISFGLSLFTSAVVIIAQNNLPPEIPLFYGLAEGPEQLSSSLGLLIPSSVSLALMTLNIFISYFLKNDFLKETLITAGFATVIFSTITTFKILFLVGSF